MATIATRKVKEAYDAILILESDTVTSAYKNIQDGSGNATGLYLKDTGVKVNTLEFETAPSTAAAGSVDVLVYNGSGATEKATITAFGQGTKDIYNGWWKYDSSSSDVIANGVQGAIENDAATGITTYAPADIAVSPITTAPDTFFEAFTEGTGYQIAMEIVVTPSSAYTTGYVEFGLDTDNDAAIDAQMQAFALPKGASVAHNIFVIFDYYVTADTSTSGMKILMKPTGADMTYSAVKMYIRRTYKR